MKKRIVLIGAADSIGVPYTRENKEHIGFFEMMEKDLSKEYEVTSINCFHMSTYNDNCYIKRLITEDISLFSIHQSQNEMLRKCKYSGIYPFIEIPKTFLHHSSCVEKQNSIVKDAIKKNDTLFIYSAFVNDVLKAQQLSLFKLLRRGRIKKELEKVNIQTVLHAIEENIKDLIKLNPHITILLIGLFVPTRLSSIRTSLKDFVLDVNEQLDTLSKPYKNVIFIRNENLSKEDFNNIDFHPNKKGHMKIYKNCTIELERRGFYGNKE